MHTQGTIAFFFLVSFFFFGVCGMNHSLLETSILQKTYQRWVPKDLPSHDDRPRASLGLGGGAHGVPTAHEPTAFHNPSTIRTNSRRNFTIFTVSSLQIAGAPLKNPSQLSFHNPPQPSTALTMLAKSS